MTKAKKLPKEAERTETAIPFDDALKRLLNAPPQHKVAKKKAVRKK